MTMMRKSELELFTNFLIKLSEKQSRITITEGKYRESPKEIHTFIE